MTFVVAPSSAARSDHFNNDRNQHHAKFASFRDIITPSGLRWKHKAALSGLLASDPSRNIPKAENTTSERATQTWSRVLEIQASRASATDNKAQHKRTRGEVFHTAS